MVEAAILLQRQLLPVCSNSDHFIAGYGCGIARSNFMAARLEGLGDEQENVMAVLKEEYTNIRAELEEIVELLNRQDETNGEGSCSRPKDHRFFFE